jgi:hypothetical protein
VETVTFSYCGLEIFYGVKFEILPTRNASVIEHCFEIGLGEPK